MVVKDSVFGREGGKGFYSQAGQIGHSPTLIRGDGPATPHTLRRNIASIMKILSKSTIIFCDDNMAVMAVVTWLSTRAVRGR